MIMRRASYLLCILLFCLNSAAVWAQVPNLAASINTLIHHRLPDADIGIVIADANTGRIIYARNALRPFTPASNQKLFTAAAALFYLGPDYRYLTTLGSANHSRQSSTLSGDVALTFSGDPSLTSADVSNLFKQLHQSGINAINGNVIIDNHYYTAPDYAPGWLIDDQFWYYAAPITSVLIDEDSLGVTLFPSNSLGKTAGAKTSGPFGGHIDADVMTVTHQQAQHHCSLMLHVDYDNNIMLHGCWPIGQKAVSFRIALTNPNLLAEEVVRKALQDNQIVLHGKITVGRAPAPDAQMDILASHQSKPLSVLLKVMLKDSNNIYAESLLKTLGRAKNGVGSFQEGVNAMEAILKDKANISFHQSVIEDGSGLSRYDLVTPMQIERLLYVVQHTPGINEIFVNALPNAGRDGTLAYRMTAFDLTGHLQAKTGSMKGISTLSGYLTTERHHRIIFSILVNHIVGKLGTARRLQDEIAATMYQQL